MRQSLSVAVAVVALATGAHASSISLQAFSIPAFNSLKQGNSVVEDFETPGNLTYEIEDVGAGRTDLVEGGNRYGELKQNSSLSSSVGSFTGLGTGGGSPTGSTCVALDVGGNGCENIALQFDPPRNAQGNLVPANGNWSLNANDTLGIEWTAFLPGGDAFRSLFFGIRDVTDQGARFELSVNSATGSDSVIFNDLFPGQLGDGNEMLVFIDFGGAVQSATIQMRNIAGGSRVLDDSFTIDAATINPALTPVPLPAPALLLLGGLGLMAGLRKRKTT